MRERDGYWADRIEVQCPWCGERVEMRRFENGVAVTAGILPLVVGHE